MRILGVVGCLWLLAGVVRAQDACDARAAEARRLHDAGEYSEAADAYVAIAREMSSCPGLDRVLYNAATNYETARLVGRAIQVHQVLVRNFPRSDLLSRSAYLIASLYHRLAIYSHAAEWYERFARDYPAAELPLARFLNPDGSVRSSCTGDELPDPGACAVARRALENAVFFRMSLGLTEDAVSDAVTYTAIYGASHPSDAALVVFSTRSVPAPEVELEHPAVIEAFSATFLTDFAGVMRLDVEARVRVERARALLALGRRADGEAELRRVVTLVAPSVVSALPSTDVGWLTRVRANEALAETYVRLADLEAPVLLGVPALTGSHDTRGIERWTTGPLTRWVERTLAVITAHEQRYADAIAVDIPSWVVEARARQGALYRDAIARARQLVVPAWADDDELGLALDDAMDAALSPLIAGATRHFGECERYAEQVRWFSEAADRCSAGLASLASRHVSDAELLGAEYVPDAPAPPLPVFHFAREE